MATYEIRQVGVAAVITEETQNDLEVQGLEFGVVMVPRAAQDRRARIWQTGVTAVITEETQNDLEVQGLEYGAVLWTPPPEPEPTGRRATNSVVNT